MALFHAILSLVERGAGLTPGPVLLPGVACFMDTMQDGESADLWQPIGSLTQAALQGGERPGGRSIFASAMDSVAVLARCVHALSGHNCGDDRSEVNRPGRRVRAH